MQMFAETTGAVLLDRSEYVEQMRATQGMEGVITSAEFDADVDEYVTGRMELPELLQRINARYGRAE